MILRVACLAALSGLCLNGSNISASWNGGAGNWSNSAQWSCSGCAFPTNGGGNIFDVMIASGMADTVQLDVTPVIINSLQVGPSSGSVSVLSTNAAINLSVTNAVTINGAGSLQINNGASLLAGSVTNSGLFQTDLAGSAANVATVSGTFANNPGATLSLGANGSADTLTVGTFQNNGAAQVGSGATLHLAGQPNGLTASNAGSALVLYGTLSAGSGTGNGLNNLSTVAGQVQINNGQSITATPSGGELMVSSMGDLRVNDGSTLTISGDVSSAGNIYTNTDTSLNSGANTLSVTGGFMNHTGGTLAVGLFQNTPGDHVSIAGTLMNNGNIFVINGTLTAGSVMNDGSMPGIQIFGPGSLIANSLSNSGTMEGGVGAAGSTIQINGAATNSGVLNTTAILRTIGHDGNSLTVSGTLTNLAMGVLNINGIGDTGSVGSLNNQGTFTVGTHSTLTIATGFTNSGTATLSGAVTAATLTNEAAGTLDLNNAGQLTGLTDVMNAGAIVLTPDGNGGGNLIAVAGTFTNEAGATVTLDGDDDMVDPSMLDNGGAVNVINGVYFVGTGTAPTLATGAEYAQDADGTLNEIFTSDSVFGVINDSGAANLAGTLNVELPGDFAASLGSVFDFLNYSSLIGSFDFFNAPVFNNGLDTFRLIYNPTNAELEVVSATSAAPEPGSLVLAGLCAGMLLFLRRPDVGTPRRSRD